MIHRAELTPQEIGEHEGMPVTTVERSIMDVLSETHRTEIARQAITDALREGLLNTTQAGDLRKLVNRAARGPSLPLNGSRVKAYEAVG